MITPILFDYGGTLDADGVHWLDRFYAIYAALNPPGPPPVEVKRAFYVADRALENDPDTLMLGLRQMVRKHVAVQFTCFGIADPLLEARVGLAFVEPTETLFDRNRQILSALRGGGYRMGVISNFYGNLASLLAESGLSGYFECLLDSAAVGLRKPDPKFFEEALDRLGADAGQTLMVGDSLDRDLRPAKSIGMKTAWLRDVLEAVEPEPGVVDATISTLAELPPLLAAWRTGAAI